MARHGVFTQQEATTIQTPAGATVGIPFVIGAGPRQAADSPAPVGQPVVCTSWDEFVTKFGYSDDWESYNLCQAAYVIFQLYGMQPVIFVNLLDHSKAEHLNASSSQTVSVSNLQARLSIDTVLNDSLSIKAESASGSDLTQGTDYTAFYADGALIIELAADGAGKNATALYVSAQTVKTEAITPSVVASGLDSIDLCMSTVGIIPDLILAPGYSSNSAVAAVMATKADGLNGIFPAKALIDADSSSSGAASYDAVYAWKNENNVVDKNQILCWPMVTLGGVKAHMSTHLAGLMASVDAKNSGIPYESPSNKNFKIDGLCLADGSQVILTKAQADMLNSFGIVTGLNFLSSGWVCWGNYTACYPSSTDVKDYMLPVSRMFDFVANTMIKTFWSKVDNPMNPRLRDTVLDSCNIWLNGMVGNGYLLGARAVMLQSENSEQDLMAGIIRIHLYLTPPSPAQEIDFVLEYDVSYVQAALAA